MSLSTDDHQPARRVLVATQFLDLGLREIGLFDLLAERRLVRHDAAHLTLFHARPELNVGAPAAHVRRDGDRPPLARPGRPSVRALPAQDPTSCPPPPILTAPTSRT